jgi:V-type H+-transporting ATPase subunit C
MYSQTGTLDGLISLSEDLPKQENVFTGVVAKIVDTLRNLLNGDQTKLGQHTLVNEKSLDEYLLKGWRWNESRYGIQRGLKEMVDVLNKVRTRLSRWGRALNLPKGDHVD